MSCCAVKHLAVIAGGLAAATGVTIVIYTFRRISSYLAKKSQEEYFKKKCGEWPRDVVILHGMPRGKTAPNASPFVLKLETFLRMYDIPYIFESEFPKGDKLKMPWITLNNEHYTDSQLIVQFLTKKFNLTLANGGYSGYEESVATLARVVIDEHFFWGFVLWRCVYSKGEQGGEIFNMTKKELQEFRAMTYSKYKHFAWCQGLGRHTQDDVIDFMIQNLRAISQILGSNKFLLGESPCATDSCVFGMLAQLIWSDTRSPFTTVIIEELPNLKEYCLRMRERYWKDWDEIIQAGK